MMTDRLGRTAAAIGYGRAPRATAGALLCLCPFLCEPALAGAPSPTIFNFEHPTIVVPTAEAPLPVSADPPLLPRAGRPARRASAPPRSIVGRGDAAVPPDAVAATRLSPQTVPSRAPAATEAGNPPGDDHHEVVVNSGGDNTRPTPTVSVEPPIDPAPQARTEILNDQPAIASGAVPPPPATRRSAINWSLAVGIGLAVVAAAVASYGTRERERGAGALWRRATLWVWLRGMFRRDVLELAEDMVVEPEGRALHEPAPSPNVPAVPVGDLPRTIGVFADQAFRRRIAELSAGRNLRATGLVPSADTAA